MLRNKNLSISLIVLLMVEYAICKAPEKGFKQKPKLQKVVIKISSELNSILQDKNPKNNILAIDKAISEYKKILKQHPDSALVHWELGWAYFYKKMPEDARQEFEIAKKLNPYYVDATRRLSKALTRKAKPMSEEDKKVKSISRKLLHVINKKGLKNATTEIKKAVKSYKKILGKNPNCVTAHVALGKAYYYKGIYKEAIKEYDKAIQLDLENSELYQNIGECYWKLAWNREHKRDYKEALEYYDKAHKFYEKALLLEPNNFWCKRKIKEIEEKEKRIRKKEKKNKIKLHWNEAMVARRSKKYKEAIIALKKILEINTTYRNSIYYSIGLTFELWGKYSEAEEMYKKQISLNPESPESHIGLMECYFKMKKFEKAKEECEIVLKRDPENKKAKRYLKKINTAEKEK